jgi:FlaA1/EpsC-like NDP-sugar epimerase
VLVVLDGVAWAVAVTFTTLGRHEFMPSRVDWTGLAIVVGLVVCGQVGIGMLSGLYTGRARFASFEEAGVLGTGASLLGAGLFVGLIGTPGSRPVPLSVAVAATALFVVLALGARYILRMIRERAGVSRHFRAHRAIVFGAGEGGSAAAKAFLRDRRSDILPVVFLDDDPAKRNLRLLGCRVAGGREHMAEVAARYGADTVVIAIPSGERSQISEIARRARGQGLGVYILPRMVTSLEAEIGIGHIRPLSFPDFLGRDEVRLDLDSIAGYIEGHRVLVTGAGGSIGSEVCSTIESFGPSDLIKLDRDENALHALQLRLEGRALLDCDSFVVADIRDSDTMHRIMELHRPDVVFHAAALKHVTFLERYPTEAAQTNVFGTLNVLRAAVDAGVARFINISSDKAADPINVLGFTKRIGEALTAGVCRGTNTVGISVRFGNVLGSRGSVVPAMRQQIIDGGPLTITDPGASRYFMTIEEAVQLAVQAGAIGETGELMVLDMGEPILIVDLVRELIAQVDPAAEIEIEYTGLRQGEKLHETLVGRGDLLLRRPHDMISCFEAPVLWPEAVDAIRGPLDGQLRRGLEALVESAGVVTPIQRRVAAVSHLPHAEGMS